MVCHQAGTGADLEFDDPDAQLLEQVMHDGIPVPAVWVIGGSGKEPLGVLLLGFVAVIILESQISALQQDSTLHVVFVHDL